MSAEIGKLISQQKQERNVTSIVVTHDIHNAKSFADRLVVLHDGKIVSQGTYEELGRSQDEFVVRYLRDAA
jgi:phospholipid/cholesterol/gamma-HCH transport system ATP-binding protein